jgi:hypothetical protein
MLTWAANHSSETAVAKILEDAVLLFEKAGSGIWADFGRLEAMARLATYVPDDEIWQKIVNKAAARTSVRTEPRSLALLHETALIALLHQERAVEWQSTFRSLNEALGKVDASLTLYSQQEKRNVQRTEFEREVVTLQENLISKDARLAKSGSA